MGANQNNGKAGGTKKRTRGSVRNTDRLAAFAASSPASGADWGGCDPARLQAVVVAITSMGGAVTFGLSRDLGAHSLTLMLDGTRKTLWLNGDADLDERLDEAIATLDAMT